MTDEAAHKTRSRVLRLAQKLKRAAERDEALEAVERQKQERLREQTEAALDRLFDDLEVLGTASGVVAVERRGRDLSLARRGRTIRIASAPEAGAPDKLLVEATEIAAALAGSLRPELDRWVLHITHPPAEGRPGTQRSLLLLEDGLEWLFEKAFGLAMADETDDFVPPGDEDWSS